MLPSLPQIYRKNIIQTIKCAHPLFSLLCRREPTGTLMRDYRTEQSPPYLRTLARTAPEACRPICVPSCVQLRCLLPYLLTLARTAPEPCRPICVPSRVRHPKLVALSAYPRGYGSDACRTIYVPSRVRHPKLVALSAYPRAYGSEACRPICVPTRVRHPKLVALSAYPRAYDSDTSAHCSALYTGFYASYCPSLHTFLIIYLYLLYKSFKGFI